MPRLAHIPLKDAVALITGAAGGIGNAIALNMARKGCHLALCDYLAEPLGKSAAAARALGVQVSEHVFDISDAAAIAALPAVVEEQHKHLTILVNCAGVALAGSFEHLSLEEFTWLFDINFWSVVRMTKAFMPLLEREAEAQIVNISSVFGLVGSPGQTAYSASKFAIRGLSEALRQELDADGKHVGVTVVHPAGVRTAIARNTRIAAGMPQERVNRDAWERPLTDSPEPVAEKIVSGAVQRKPRILCGKWAYMADKTQRLMPVSFPAAFRLGARIAGG